MSDESKGAVTVYETTPRYRIEVSGHSGQPEHPIPRQMVSKDDYDALAARLAAAEARGAEVEGERVPMPAGLHPSTKQLVVKFAKAMAAKLRRAEMRYGYSDEWANAENIDGMRREFWSHADKGDPVDVANFAAFLWHHSQSTCGNPLAAANAELHAEIDRINDAQAASLGAEIVRLTEANAAQAREIERLRTLLGRAKDELNSGPLEDRDALYELVTNAEPSWGEDAWAWKIRTDELCREIGAALASKAGGEEDKPAQGAAFAIGDRVEKRSGDYSWQGEVCAVFRTPNGHLRYVVAHPVDRGYVLHIYGESNLAPLAPAADASGEVGDA